MIKKAVNALIKARKRLRVSAVAIAVLAIVVCELPILLALLGLGGLATTTSIFSLSQIDGKMGITLALGGLFLLTCLLLYVLSRGKS